MNRELSNCLDILQEECAEVIQVISKIKRFGLDSYHPSDPDRLSNEVKLARELGDVEGTTTKLLQLIYNDDWRASDHFLNILEEYRENKPRKIDKYFEYTKVLNNE
jgi:NTP pyrophosphatase (non-canonical NTP hydrolase)